MAMQPDELKRMRKGLGLTQGELGKRLGYTQGYIGELERGEKNIEPRVERYVTLLSDYQALLDGLVERQIEDGKMLEQLSADPEALQSNGRDATQFNIENLSRRITQTDELIAKKVAEYGLIDRRVAK